MRVDCRVRRRDCVLPVEIEERKQDYIYIEKEWNYFSTKDGVKSKLRVCESCFDEWTKQFVIPPLMEEVTEIV